MIRQFSRIQVAAGSIIQFDDTPGRKYKVVTCIKLDMFGAEGYYQLNLIPN